MKRLAIGVLALFAACAAPPTHEQIIQRAKEKVYPAVVFIKPIQEEYAGGERKQVQIFGSGAIIHPDGYVVTNHHVAEKATDITCVLSDKEEVHATVVGLDPETDLGVIKLDLSERKSKTPLTTAVFGNSDGVHEGDLVMAMGAPHGFNRSVTHGIISCTERFFDFARYNIWFQTDAAINPGNSGGPLVNTRGQIIGITSLQLRGAENMGFAIPSNVARRIVLELIRRHEETGKESAIERAWTGMQFQALRDFTRSTHMEATEGVLVASIDEGSPAEKAGLQMGDLIVRVNEAPVNGTYETDLPGVEQLFAGLPLGEKAALDVRRSGEDLKIAIVPTKKGRQEGEEFECKKWEMTVREITKFSDKSLHFFRPKGVYVLGTKSSGNAEESGLWIRDVITHIGEREIESLEDLKKAYEEAIAKEKGKRRLILKLIRSGYPQYVVLNFEKDPEEEEEKEKEEGK
ncbi:MAG: trypsin-like peptidase domain-containing protein [Planctomycetota bacterium]|jgi:serine protease Do